jgi:cephalosporin-C deacetylase-like acetyl esterase
MLGNKKVKRFDVELTNPRGLTFSGSHFIPMDSENYPCVIYMHGNSSNRMEGTEYLP